MNHIEAGPCISVYENVFDANRATLFLACLDEAAKNEWDYPEISWDHAYVGGGEVTSYRTSVNCSLVSLMKPYPDTELSSLFRDEIQKPLEKVASDYMQEHFISNGIHEPYQVLKYFPGAEYHSHWDHSRNNSRVFSLVASMGEAEEGGELEFPKFGVKLKLTNGSAVLFPANFPYIHIAHPVISGVKTSLVTWFS